MFDKGRLIVDTADDTRNHGLDIARALAIAMVLMSHSIYLFSFESGVFTNRYWGFEIFGYFGVELFFVLSGFLIGGILLRLFTGDFDGLEHWKRKLVNFYLRRWFRTLPLYYAILFFNVFFWEAMSFWDFVAEGRQVSWHYIFFLQNCGITNGLFFPESWSLAVEEWFYLLWPLVLIGSLAGSSKGGRNPQTSVGYIIAGSVVAVVLFRLVTVMSGDVSFDQGIRKNTFLRLDSLAVGVLLAYCRMYKAATFQRLAGRDFGLAAVLVLVAVAGWFWQVGWPGWDKSLLARTLMLDIVSVSFAFIIAYLYQQRFTRIKVFALLSRLAYSMYLVHLPVIIYLSYWSSRLDNPLMAPVLWGVAAIVIWGICRLIYCYFEKPIMDLRPAAYPEKSGIAGGTFLPFMETVNEREDK
ncbi:MAG TPA: acyltransferase [Patescibacteria group bacterium]|nr:acyltransferase [Patescibacteria group bacterium]